MDQINSLPRVIWGLLVALILVLFAFNAQISRFLGATGDEHDQHIMVVGTNLWPGYEPLYLAQEWGILNPSKIHLIEFSSASKVIRAFQNGMIQAAALTLDEAALLKAKGLPLSIILVMDISHGGDVLLAKPQIKSPEQLKGKRIGLEESAVGAYVLSRFLEIHHIKENEVTIVPLDVDQHQEAYLQDRVDAVITFEPVRSHLLAKGARELFSSKDIPGEIMDVLVADPQMLQKHGEEFNHLVQAWMKALKRMEGDRPGATQILAQRMNLPPEEVWDCYEGLILPDLEQNLQYLSGSSPKIQQQIDALMNMMVKKQLIAGISDWDDSVASGPIQSIGERL